MDCFAVNFLIGSYHDYHSGPMQPSCGIPMVQTNVVVNGTNHINFTVGYLLTYFCNRSSSNTVAKAATSVCAEGGKWIPNPLEYTCENLPNSRGKHHATRAG